MATFRIRKLLTLVDETLIEEEREAPRPLRRVAALAVVSNPYAGQGYVADLGEAVRWSAELGTLLGQRAVAALGAPVEGYGKGAIAGLAGAQEHAVAFLTSSFGDAFRATVGGGKAWIPSTTKVGPAGAALDIPTAYKDALWVRSHYDTLTVQVPDAPRPDEVVVAVVVTSGGRLNARLGGLRKDEVRGEDGLR
ncbi:MAG TPA: amino acid synthesis family protein [Chloroflexota bacterium]|nr:amino acid synthesis family protein [Chloroflexota bacterium]